MIGAGINGAGEAFAEFQKKEQTCFFGTIAMSSTLTGATISGVLVGVLIKGSVQDAMSLMNVPTFYRYLIRAGFCC